MQAMKLGAVLLLTLALPAKAETAQKLFAAHCAPCHGPAGDGGKGANLAAPRLLHAPDDNALAEVILHGIPGTEMPPTRLTEEETRALVAYVRSLGRLAPLPVAENAGHGEKVFRGKEIGRAHV